MEPILDLVIIGAGPTGLLSAVLASKLNLTAVVLDKREGPLEVGRADALNARTQQTLDSVDILHHLLPLGLKCNTSSTFKEGGFASRDNRWWTSLKNTHFKEFLMIGQPEVEKTLLSQITNNNNKNVQVEYNCTVSKIEENGDKVIIENTEGKKWEAKYVIAADGAHSIARKILNIGFHGVKPNMKWAVLDTFLKTDFPVCPEIISFELNGQARVAWIPRERGMARFYILLDGGEITQERSEESIRQHLAPYTVEFVKTEWFSQFDVQERIADSFISEKGRIIFAGDSAHVHSVNGGQGLNTGIADSFALLWRLGLVIHGFEKNNNNNNKEDNNNSNNDNNNSDSVLVKSYNQERRDTAQTVINVAANLVRSTLRTAKEYVEIVEKSAANITGMGIRYNNSSPLVIDGSFEDFVSGLVTPDFSLSSLSSPSSPSIRFYQLFEYGKFILLKPSCVSLSLSSSAVRVWNVEKENDSFVVTTDKGEKYTTTFPLSTDTAIVVRPDLYTGYVGSNPQEYFDRFLL